MIFDGTVARVRTVQGSSSRTKVEWKSVLHKKNGSCYYFGSNVPTACLSIADLVPLWIISVGFRNLA